MRRAAAKTVLLLAGLAFAPAALAQNAAPGASNLGLTNDQPIEIEADRLEVDETKAVATFTGNVNVVQGETNLKADRMVVFYKAANPDAAKAGGLPSTGSTTIDRMEVTGKVYVKSGTQIATGDEGAFDVSSNTLTLSGKQVELSDGPTTLNGCKLVVNMTTRKSSVDSCGGRVRMKTNETKS